MRSIRNKLSTLLLVLLLAVAPPIAMTGCSNAQVENNIRAFVAGGRDVVTEMRKKDPNNPLLAKAERWVADGQAFLDAYRAAPAACADLATRAAALVTAFQSSIVPLINVSPGLATIIAGVDVALRVVVANFHNCIQKAAAIASKTRSIASSDADAVQSADAVFTQYLLTPKLKK